MSLTYREVLKNAASGVPCLRRASFAEGATKAESGFAQAGRPLAGLMYSSVRSAHPSSCGLAVRAFLNTPHDSRMAFSFQHTDQQLKYGNYSTAS